MLESVLPPPVKSKLTRAEFEALYADEATQQIEFINGEVIVSSPTLNHKTICMNLSILVGQAIKTHQLGRFMAAPCDVYMGDEVAQPDLFFIAKTNKRCIPTAKRKWQGAPDLCIEVVSPSSGKMDRETKFKLYQAEQVYEYWIVDPYAQVIEVFTLAEDRYQRVGIYGMGDTLISPLLPQLTFAIEDAFSAE